MTEYIIFLFTPLEVCLYVVKKPTSDRLFIINKSRLVNKEKFYPVRKPFNLWLCFRKGD